MSWFLLESKIIIGFNLVLYNALVCYLPGFIYRLQRNGGGGYFLG